MRVTETNQSIQLYCSRPQSCDAKLSQLHLFAIMMAFACARLRLFFAVAFGVVVVVLTNCRSASAFTLTHYRPDTSPTIQRFLEFLEQENCEGIGAVEIGHHTTTTEGDVDAVTPEAEKQLRGLFAVEDFAPGDYMVAIPFGACILVHESVYDVVMGQDSQAEISDVEKGAVLLELLANPHWRPYSDCLPTRATNFAATPDFWDEDTIRQLEVPKLVQHTLAIQRATTTTTTESLLSLPFATWLLRSRAFGTYTLIQNGPKQQQRIRTRTVLIPFLDFLNHSATATSNARIEVVESKQDDEESFYALIATQNIAAGDPVTITYGTGHETTLDLFTKYGFWTEDNPNDTLLNLENVPWSSTLEEDEQQLAVGPPSGEIRDMLRLRIHLKRLQRQQRQQ